MINQIAMKTKSEIFSLIIFNFEISNLFSTLNSFKHTMKECSFPWKPPKFKSIHFGMKIAVFPFKFWIVFMEKHVLPKENYVYIFPSVIKMSKHKGWKSKSISFSIACWFCDIQHTRWRWSCKARSSGKPNFQSATHSQYFKKKGQLHCNRSLFFKYCVNQAEPSSTSTLLPYSYLLSTYVLNFYQSNFEFVSL